MAMKKGNIERQVMTICEPQVTNKQETGEKIFTFLPYYISTSQ